ncbi:hypothetical protein FACS189445_2310 [Spirochaetia bacterium]|nr:hypothetical protein FACS189445_2310 [Spirochaetia bacterium]
MLVFSPRGSSPASVTNVVTPIPAGKPSGPSAEATELVKKTLTPQGLKTTSESGPQDNIVYFYGENPDDAVPVNRTGSGGSNRVVVDVQRPTPVVVPEAPAPRLTAKPAAPPARPAPVAAAPKAATPKAPAPKAAAPKAAAPKTPDNFWVQTGSFSSVARAEAAKNTLASKGITSLIENREVEGKTYFRVRVGPYTSKNEADYWRELIKSINGFEDSLVWKSPAR